MTTRVWVFSIASSAACSSAIMWIEIAFRFSGLFSVMVESWPVVSKCKVSKFMNERPLPGHCLVRILGPDFIGQFDHLGQFSSVDTGMHARLDKGAKHALRRDVANKVVSREGAAAQSRESGIEPPAAGLVGGQNLDPGIFGPRVEMHAQLNASDVILHSGVDVANEFRRGGTNRVCKRNGSNANVFEPLECVLDDFGSPGLGVRIAEGH